MILSGKALGEELDNLAQSTKQTSIVLALGGSGR